MRSFAALLLVLAPLAARAEPDAAPTAAAPAAAAAPQWSLGAGVLAFTSGSVFASTDTFLVPAFIQAAQASLERRLVDETWLVVGLSGFVDRQRTDLPAGVFGRARDDRAGTGLSAGVRRLVTSRGAPVGVSLVLLGSAGVTWQRQDQVTSTETVVRVTAWAVGARAGIAVDRELVSNLSLRVATSLVGVGSTWSRTELTDGTNADGSAFSAGFQLSPSLELRLAF